MRVPWNSCNLFFRSTQPYAWGVRRVLKRRSRAKECTVTGMAKSRAAGTLSEENWGKEEENPHKGSMERQGVSF